VIGLGPTSFTLVIANRGGRDLVIDKIKSDCGCIGPITSLFQKAIAPGKRGKVCLRIPQRIEEGEYKNTVCIYSNDPNQPLYLIRIVGRHRLPISVSSYFCDFGDIVKGDTKRGSLRVHCKGPEIFNPDKILCDKPISINVYPYYADMSEYAVKAHTSGKGSITIEDYMIDVTLDARYLPLGIYKSYITIDKRSNVAVLVKARVVGDLELTPETFYFGLVSRSSVPRESIMVKSRACKPFEIEAIDTNNLPIAIEKIKYTENGETRYKLVCTLNDFGRCNTDMIYGSAIITTDRKEEPQIRIRVLAMKQ
jgi:hypothetical protein